jgi:hypothetical protein
MKWSPVIDERGVFTWLEEQGRDDLGYMKRVLG